MKTVDVTIFLALCVMPAVAQTPEPAPKFEVASIKKSAPGGTGVLYHLPGGRFKADKSTLLSLISFAYEVPASQVTGLPKWASTDRFDVEAKADGPAEADPKKMEMPAKKAMVRQLLAERFQLEVRREERDTPIYSLVTSQGGPKLARNADKPYLMQPRKFQKVSMGDFAKFLSNTMRSEIGRLVVDKTGIEGEFDFNLIWAPMSGAPATGTREELPSIFTAVQEQLGLKLQPDHGLVSFVVIENASPPSEN